MAEATENRVRSKEEILADLSAARERLSGNVADLIDQVHPNRIKQREVAKIKQVARSEFDNARSHVVNPDGSVRVDRIALVGGALAGLVTFVVVMRTIVRRIKGRRNA